MFHDAARHLERLIASQAIGLKGNSGDYEAVRRLIRNARFVLIGEATHGSEEFYRFRAGLTRQLIEQDGFSAVAVEGDWPDCYRVNRFVRGDERISTAEDALSDFKRFPAWMWRNEVVAEFVDWLRTHNAGKPAEMRTGFYGLDLYSLYASIQAVITYLDEVDPPAARQARDYYACFDHGHKLARNPQQYGYSTVFGISESCERHAVDTLVSLRRKAAQYLAADGFDAAEDYFSADRNARTVVDAETYYRAMFRGRISSWNLRDRHMAETLDALTEHLDRQTGAPAKIVVWAHNSHVGDARATEMGTAGEFNIGQLVREAHGEAAFLLGFSTCSGEVTAASRWDGPAERKAVRRALPQSYEALFHDSGLPNFLLSLKGSEALNQRLTLSRLQRAIGVLYLPETERQSHYFFSKLPEQFDAIIHFDRTHALRPLEPSAPWHKGEVFETYPSGF